MNQRLQALLAQLPPSEQVDFSQLLSALYTVRHTGPITLHLFNGVLKQVDLGPPIRLSIVEGQDKLDSSRGGK